MIKDELSDIFSTCWNVALCSFQHKLQIQVHLEDFFLGVVLFLHELLDKGVDSLVIDGRLALKDFIDVELLKVIFEFVFIC